MRSLNVSVTSSLLCYALLGACQPSRDEFAHRLAEAHCRRRLECCADTFPPPDYTTMEQCLAMHEENVVAYVAALETEFARYDSGAAAACLDALERMPCGVGAETVPECHRVFVATLSVGERCTVASECESEICSFDAGRICVESAAEGEPCSSDAGVLCDAGLVCSAGTCVVPAPGCGVLVYPI